MIDGIYLYKLINVIKEELIGSRIDKIYQPNEKLLIFRIKNNKLDLNKLVISIDPNFCSLHLSSISLINPDQPTSFCMLLRKHLESGIIVDIKQFGYERIIELSIESYNELGIKTLKVLHIELMGKYANVILTDSKIIVDAIYKYPIGVNGFREILSKRAYILPPLNNKLTLDDKNINKLLATINNKELQDLSLSTFLQQHLQGFGKKSMNDLIELLNLKDMKIGNLNTNHLISLRKGIIEYREALDVKNVNIKYETDTAFNQFYFNKEIGQKKQILNSIVNKQIKKLIKKANIYKDKINQDTDSENLRIKGELLSANLYQINKRLNYVDLENYYDPELPIMRIDLNEALSPSQNVKQYFKKYHKVKEGKKQSEILLNEVGNELDYFNSIEVSINNCNDLMDLQEIRDELESIGLLQKKSKGKKPAKKLNYLRVELDNGDIILIGKNNKQNDYLTFKDASNRDLWFHRQDYPGAHVILKSIGEPNNESIEKAAWYAGFYGNNDNLDGVTVDYTFKKHVKRHPSLKLGKVFYTDFNSIYINKKISQDK
ncbi:MAG: NFACT RNA binding domain-containing protein [Firmicutes bacterium]|nr:NFACT RNA binding domain-containing protein [Bacillota bacterium]